MNVSTLMEAGLKFLFAVRLLPAAEILLRLTDALLLHRNSHRRSRAARRASTASTQAKPCCTRSRNSKQAGEAMLHVVQSQQTRRRSHAASGAVTANTQAKPCCTRGRHSKHAGEAILHEEQTQQTILFAVSARAGEAMLHEVQSQQTRWLNTTIWEKLHRKYY